MPRTDPRKAGATVQVAANRVLSDHSAKNIFGGNLAKHFLQGTVVNVFDGRAPGGRGEDAIWKLTVDFVMPSKDTCRRRCASCAIESTRGERSGRGYGTRSPLAAGDAIARGEEEEEWE